MVKFELQHFLLNNFSIFEIPFNISLLTELKLFKDSFEFFFIKSIFLYFSKHFLVILSFLSNFLLFNLFVFFLIWISFPLLCPLLTAISPKIFKPFSAFFKLQLLSEITLLFILFVFTSILSTFFPSEDFFILLDLYKEFILFLSSTNSLSSEKLNFSSSF